jgi:hypothetical protein
MKEAKTLHYGRLIAKSNNKIKTTWNIIKKETGKGHPIEQAPSLHPRAPILNLYK